MIIIKKIKIKNFLSVGNKGIELELNKGKVNLIIGNIGQGKSLLIDALNFALFGAPYRKIKKESLINVINLSNLLVELEFQKGNINYLVRRGIKPNIFEIYREGELINIDARSRDYQEKLNNILGFNNLIFNQIFCISGMNYKPFFTLSKFEKDKIKEKIFNLTILNIINELVKKYLKKIDKKKNELENKKELIIEKNLYLKKIINDVMNNIINNDELQNLIKENNEIEEKILKLENLKNKINIEKYEKWYNNIYKLEKELEIEIKNNNKKERIFLKNICPLCSQRIDSKLREREIKKVKEKNRIINKKLNKIKKILKKIKKNIKNKKSVINNYEKEINSLKIILYKNKKLIEKIDKKRINFNKNYEQELKNNKEFLKELNKSLKFIKDKNEILLMIQNLLNSNSIKNFIIKKYLPILNKYFLNYLNSLEFKYLLYLNENLDLIVKNEILNKFNYMNFSSGERTKINIALIFSFFDLIKLVFNVNMNLLIIDEIFDSSFDEESIQLMINLLKKKNMNVFIISHRIENTFEYDNIYRVTKEKFTKYEKIKN